jgi:hypothetical protein
METVTKALSSICAAIYLVASKRKISARSIGKAGGTTMLVEHQKKIGNGKRMKRVDKLMYIVDVPRAQQQRASSDGYQRFPFKRDSSSDDMDTIQWLLTATDLIADWFQTYHPSLLPR